MKVAVVDDLALIDIRHLRRTLRTLQRQVVWPKPAHILVQDVRFHKQRYHFACLFYCICTILMSTYLASNASVQSSATEDSTRST